MIYINEMPPFWADVLGVDLETTSLDPHEGRILSITLSDGNDSYVFLHWFKFDCLKDVLEDEKVIKVLHNAKFDLKWIKKHLGFEVKNIYCSMLAEQVLVAARDMGVSLADVAARRVGTYMEKGVRETFYDHPGFHIKPVTQDQIEYMADDVIILPKIRESQLKEAEELSCVWPIEIENQAVSAFAEIELNGFVLDVDRWYEYVLIFNDEIEKSTPKLRELLGENYVLTFMNKSVKNPKEKVIPVDKINFGSPDQLLRILNSHYKLDLKSTNEKILLELQGTLKENHPAIPFIDELLRRRHFIKAIGWNYPKFVNSMTGKVHPDFRQIGTDTARVAASDPNMQQVPRPVEGEPNMRQLWCADAEDLVILCSDYSSQEVRVLAQICGDQNLIKACTGKDIYSFVGSLMYNREIKKSDPERGIAKIFLLAGNYGSGLDRLHKQSGLSIKQCKEVEQVIDKTFPGMKAYRKRAEGYAKRNNYIFSVTGRRRYFNANSRIYTEAVNTVIQSTSLDMFKIALGTLYEELNTLKKNKEIDSRTRIWHVLHDEIAVQCHKDEAEKVAEIVSRHMVASGYKLCPDITHLAETHWEHRWNK